MCSSRPACVLSTRTFFEIPVLNLAKSDQQIVSEAVDIVDAMAALCHKENQLRWDGRAADEEARQSAMATIARMSRQSTHGSSTYSSFKATISYPSRLSRHSSTLDEPSGKKAQRGWLLLYNPEDAERDAEALETQFKNFLHMQVLQVQRPDDSDGGSRAEVSEPVDLHQVLPLVMNADAAVVLLTRNVLADPAVLLGLFWAVVKGVPLVPMTVHVRGQPKETQYDYHEAKEFLNALTL